MPGLRQHYLPQFLLRGFSCETKGKEVYTWAFSKNKLPFQVNIKKIGIEKGFYGDPDKSDLDEKITLAENRLSNYINELRKTEQDKELDSSDTSELIHHIFVRVKNIRSAIINANDFIFRIIIENSPNSDSLQKGILNYFKKNPKVILDKIERELGRTTKYNRNLIMNQLVPAYLKENKELILFIFIKFIKTAKETISNTTPNAHLETLSKIVIPEERLEAIKHLTKSFNWNLFVREPGSFILGDVGPIARIENTNSYCSLLVGIKKFDIVLLPISNNHLIIGTKYNHKEEVDIDLINNSVSLCSIEYFISSFNSSREEKYHSSLAKKSTVLPESVLKEIADNFLADFLETID